jgi:flotillin
VAGVWCVHGNNSHKPSTPPPRHPEPPPHQPPLTFAGVSEPPTSRSAAARGGLGVKAAPARREDVELGPDGQPTAQAAAASKTFKIVTGGGKLVIPVLQKAQYLSLRADAAELEVTGVDKQKIPVGVNGVAIFKVGDDDESITNAATRFLDEGVGAASQMHHLVKEVFHGHLRSIIGGLSVEDLIANRNELAQETRDASVQEMQKLGLVVDSLQIQDVIDPSGYIAALGEPRAAEVKMQARIAQAAADREATEREQEAEALKAAAQRDTALKMAGYQAERERAMAMTAQAGPLADAEARKQVVVQETEVADLEAQREEKRLETTVKKPADAEAYRLRVEAVGQREARVELAEASKREVELKAEADARRIELAATAMAKQTREVGAADASAIQAKGEAQGASIRATGLAEAEAIGKRAEALERESDAVIGQQLADKLPEIVAAAATAFSNVDNLTVLNGAQGISEIMNQVIGQAGPAMKMAKDALGTTNGGGPEETPS